MTTTTPSKIDLFTENLGSTMQKLMELHNINMHQLHKNTGVSLTTINRILNEKNVNPTITSLIPLANYFSVTLNQLMGIDPLESDCLIGKYAHKRNLWTTVPIIPWEDATDWPDNLPNLTINNIISTDTPVSKSAFALVITETNWEGFFPNSIIIADTTLQPTHGDYAIIVKKGQKKSSLKQLLLDDDKIYLRPLNQNYQTQVMDESFKIVGVVVQVRMDIKY